MARGDTVEAISHYRQAVNQAPLSDIPRLKLARAYIAGGFHDKALNEARRALQIAPDSDEVQKFMVENGDQNGASEVAAARFSSLVARNPNDIAAHLGLGDAYLSSGSASDAVAEYKKAKRLSAPDEKRAAIHLAEYYAAQGQYDNCLVETKAAGGEGGYGIAVHVAQSSADALSQTISAAQDAFLAGKSTREDFYNTAKKMSLQTKDLAQFIAKVVPPHQYKVSYLHRTLAASLLAQQAAVLVSYIETGDNGQAQKIDELEKSAQTELLTAHASEQKLGLWNEKG